jgi:hypothetical protein
MRLMQNTYLFSVKIEMPLEKELKSLGYTYGDGTLSNYW